ACDFRALNFVQPGCGGGKLLPQLSRRLLPHRRKLHRDVRRVVAMLGIARPVKLDRSARKLAQPRLETRKGGIRQRLRAERTALRGGAAPREARRRSSHPRPRAAPPEWAPCRRCSLACAARRSSRRAAG